MDTEVRRTFPKKGAKKPVPPTKSKKKLLKQLHKADPEAKSKSKTELRRMWKEENPALAQQQAEKRKRRKAQKKQKPVAQVFEAHESSPDHDEIQEIPQVNTGKNKKQPSPKVVNLDSDDDDDDDEDLEIDTMEVDKVDEEPNDSAMEVEEDEVNDGEKEKDEGAEFRKKIAKMPMADVRKLRDNLGLKLFNKLYFSKPEDKKLETAGKKLNKKNERTAHGEPEEKKGQHRPREISSRKPVSSFRNIFKNECLSKKKWDPRFDERAGTLKEHCFDDNYQFLDEMKQQEKEDLRKELYQAVENGDEATASRITNAIRKMEEQERVKKDKDLKKAAMTEIRQENIDRMMQGQQPRFLPKAQVRQKIMEKKFDQLKSEKRLDKYLEKKAKKQSQKEKKKKGLVQHSFEDRYGYGK